MEVLCSIITGYLLNLIPDIIKLMPVNGVCCLFTGWNYTFFINDLIELIMNFEKITDRHSKGIDGTFKPFKQVDFMEDSKGIDHFFQVDIGFNILFPINHIIPEIVSCKRKPPDSGFYLFIKVVIGLVNII